MEALALSLLLLYSPILEHLTVFSAFLIGQKMVRLFFNTPVSVPVA